MLAQLGSLLADPKVQAALLALGVLLLNFIRTRVANGSKRAWVLDKILAFVPDLQKLFGTTAQPLPGGVKTLAEAASVLKDSHP